MDKQTEVTNQIYDTIMQNVGISPHHVVFDVNAVDDCWIDSNVIGFVYRNNSYRVTVERTV